MAYCTNCATEMSDQAAACPSCGHPAAGSGTASGPRANFGQRLVAALIDAAMLAAVGFVLSLALKSAGQGIAQIAGIAYYIYLEGSPSGQTVGKKVMGIRVIRMADGLPIGYGPAAIRYFGRIVSAIPCGLGYWWMLWDKEKQTWHDKFAGSVVVPASSYPVDAWPG